MLSIVLDALVAVLDTRGARRPLLAAEDAERAPLPVAIADTTIGIQYVNVIDGASDE